MQIDGLGNSHSASDHHVTNCIFDHHEIRKNVGAAAMKASAPMGSSAAKAELQQEGQLSLSAWLKNMLGSGKGFLLNFWDGGQVSAGVIEGDQTAINSAEGSHSAESQAVIQTGVPDSSAAVVTVQPAIQSHINHNTSYFMGGADTENQKQTFWQKVRTRFYNVSGQLNGRLHHKFFSFQAKNSFQAKQEKTREDLRRHSRYRRDTVEINCAPTEESYLMDSYDRKGEYSRLTTKK